MNKMDNLIEKLDESSLVLSLKESLEKVNNDQELKKLLEEYSNNPTNELKSKIIENSTFQEFKVRETELNIFIMELNKKLKTITKKGICSHENN